jgi:transposase
METTRANQAYCVARVLYMALELSAKKWVVLFSDGTRRCRQVVVSAGDRLALLAQIGLAKTKLGLPADVPVVSCYEAGRDGFWLHRWLASVGVDNRVVDPASIEVPQRAKRVKTDRVDVQKLLQLLLRWHGGESQAWHEVRVPSVAQEDERHLQRERDRLKKEHTGASNRIASLLVTQGIELPLNKHFMRALDQVRCWDGTPLPAQLRGELERQWERYELAGRHMAVLLAQQRQRLSKAAAEDTMAQQMKQLMRLCSVGVQSAWTLSAEVFAWREIKNRWQIGALAGLTPTPYASGQSEREQGISKAGIARVRTAMIELSWLWLRHQGDSALSRWFQRRFGSTGSKRSRRIGIVALARRLLVALWRYLHSGVIPDGAVLKRA